MSVLAVLHPRGVSSRLWRAVATDLRARGLEVVERETRARRHAAEIVRESSGADLVVAVGGDGTVFEAVNGLMGLEAPPPFGLVPVGTGNDFARAVGVPREAAALVAAFASGRSVPLDLGLLTCPQGEFWFTASATLGFSGAVTRRVEDFPRVLPGTAVYLVSLLVSLLSWKSGSGRVVADGVARDVTRLFNLNVANTRFYGGGMIAAPAADPRDGRLDLVLMELTKLGVLRAMPENYRGRFERVPGVWQERVSHLRVESDRPLFVQADGEVVGTTPVEVRVVPGALRMVGVQNIEREPT